MEESKVLNYIEEVLENAPQDWLKLTTHRLDIYDESMAKTRFLAQFEDLFKSNNAETPALSEIPTAFDYIRLGHPLSCILEWAVAYLNKLKPENVISFSSRTAPVLAILRKNLWRKRIPEYIIQRLYRHFLMLKPLNRFMDIILNYYRSMIYPIFRNLKAVPSSYQQKKSVK